MPTDGSRMNEPNQGMATLTSRLAAGDERAFNALYERFCDRLYRYLIVMAHGDEPMARDLLQAAWIKLVRSGRVFHEETHLWNWLTRVARNQHIDQLRRQSRTPNLVSLEETGADVERAPAATAMELLLDEALAHGLGRLAPDEHRLVDGFYFQKLSQQDLAERGGASVRAVESRLGRIRQKLRQLILDFLQNEAQP